MPYNTSRNLDFSKTGNFTVANNNAGYLLDNVNTKIIGITIIFLSLNLSLTHCHSGFDEFYDMFARLKAEEVGAIIGSDAADSARLSDGNSIEYKSNDPSGKYPHPHSIAHSLAHLFR